MKLFMVLMGMLLNYVSCNIADKVTESETLSMAKFMEMFTEMERKVERINEMEINLSQFKEIERKMTDLQSKIEGNEAKYISEIVLLKEENRLLKLHVDEIVKKNDLLNSRVNAIEKEFPITSNIHENESVTDAFLKKHSNAGEKIDTNHDIQESTQRLEGIDANDLVETEFAKPSLKRTSRIVLSDGEGPVAFCATFHAAAQEQHLGTNQVITYDKLIINIGGGFHMAHGLFTAPQSGIYLLSSSVLSYANHRVIAGIVINGVPVAQMFANGGGDSDQGSQTIIVQLHLGDDVAVEILQVNDVSIWGEMYTSFSGYLLTRI